MGNQHSGGMQFCSGSQLYTSRNPMSNYKSDQETRVGWAPTKLSAPVQRQKRAHQQVAPQQQKQEEIVEIQLPGPGKWQIPKSTFDVNEPLEVAPKTAKKSFNVYISCLDLEGRSEDNVGAQRTGAEESDILDHFKDDVTVFEGIFGNVIINKNGLVLYTDISGGNQCEEYDQDTIGKIFPMGIAHGALSKSIWFEDALTRDKCFDVMKSISQQCDSVAASPPKYIPEDEGEDDDNMKVFEGINDTNVIVHSENLVLYTDLDDKKHCVIYNKFKIQKCFPNGIHGGDLPRTIWFDDQIERDLCFMLMKWNMWEMEENVQEDPQPVIAPIAVKYHALYGDVVLHHDSQIEYTSLNGETIKCFYDPSGIQEVFPSGISYGRLPNSIWFQDAKERDNCISTMRKM